MVHWVVLVAVVIVIAILVQAVMDRQFLNVSGRYVLITGCDTGFGYLLARTLSHKRKLNVIATCLTKAGMQKFQENGDGAIGRITPIQMDVTNSESIHQALAKVKQILPENTGLWGLINNAGINGPIGCYDWLKRDEITRVLEVNLVGSIEVANVFFPLIRKAQGRIVNMSSMVGIFPTVSMVYALSKAGVEAFSDNIRVVMKNLGVSVHILEPAAFKTNLTNPEVAEESLRMVWDRLSEEEKTAAGGEVVYRTMQRGLRGTLSRASPNLHLVTDAAEHALCARWPWRRYLPGAEAKFFCKPMSMLPAFLADYIILWIKAGIMRVRPEDTVEDE
ncbi:retinol dehydrogenase 7-like [Asterias amurensis]|uniref:retinol dehydrogenase 7-like n=1 Tax=Asterias amurensis TaxID=7602 RepID=UPI003AB249AC